MRALCSSVLFCWKTYIFLFVRNQGNIKVTLQGELLPTGYALLIFLFILSTFFHCFLQITLSNMSNTHVCAFTLQRCCWPFHPFPSSYQCSLIVSATVAYACFLISLATFDYISSEKLQSHTLSHFQFAAWWALGPGSLWLPGPSASYLPVQRVPCCRRNNGPQMACKGLGRPGHSVPTVAPTSFLLQGNNEF